MKIQEIPRSTRIALAGVGLLAGWFLFVPPLADIQRLSRERSQLKSEQEQTRRLLDRFYRERIGLLPERASLPEILASFHEKARRHRVEILSVSPGAVSDRNREGVAFCPVELQLEGEYQALGEFLGELQKDPSGWKGISIRRLRIGREERFLPRLAAHLHLEVALQ